MQPKIIAFLIAARTVLGQAQGPPPGYGGAGGQGGRSGPAGAAPPGYGGPPPGYGGPPQGGPPQGYGGGGDYASGQGPPGGAGQQLPPGVDVQAIRSLQSKIQTFYASITAQPQWTSVESVLETAIPESLYDAPPAENGLMPKGFSTQAWWSAMPQDARDYIISVGGEIQSIINQAAPNKAGAAPGAAATTAATAAPSNGSPKKQDSSTSSSSSSSDAPSSSGTTAAKTSAKTSASKNYAAVQTPGLGAMKGAIAGVMAVVAGGAVLL